MRAVKGHAPKRAKVFPVQVKLKKPKLKPLPLVRVKETEEIGFLMKKTRDFVVVFLQSGEFKKFHRHELEKIKIIKDVGNGHI